MCGFAFENPDGDSSSAARTSGRVRQRTVSKSREEILAALEQAEHGGQLDSGAAPGGGVPASAENAHAGGYDDFETEPEPTGHDQGEPEYENGHHEAEYEAQHQAEEIVEEAPQEEVIDETEEVSQPEEEAPAPAEYYAAAEEVATDVSEEIAEPVHDAGDALEAQESPVAEEFVEEEQFQEEASELVAYESSASDEVIAEPEVVVEQKIASAHVEEEHVEEEQEPQVSEATVEEEQVIEVQPEAVAARAEANIPPKSHREHDAGFRHRGEERNQKQGGNQQVHEGGQQMSRDGNRDENQSQHGGHQQSGRHNQQGQRGNQGQQGGHDRGDRGRQHDNRHHDNRQRDRDNRRNGRDQQHGGQSNQMPRHRHEESRRGEVRSPVSADALIGWIVIYESPGGVSTELRGSKFFISREQIRATDLVIDDPSVSSPHCLVSSSANGTLILQDLLSENGISVKRAGSASFENLDESCSVSSGDIVRFGSAEFLVVLVP